MNKFLVFLFLSVVVFLDTNIALASNPERLVCYSRNSATIVVIEQLPVVESVNSTASMLIVKLSGKILGDRIPLAGSKEQTAKGPYYDLQGPDGYGIFVSAPASYSFSELTVGNKVINLTCE